MEGHNAARRPVVALTWWQGCVLLAHALASGLRRVTEGGAGHAEAPGACLPAVLQHARVALHDDNA
jgi:hypothetical protein